MLAPISISFMVKHLTIPEWFKPLSKLVSYLLWFENLYLVCERKWQYSSKQLMTVTYCDLALAIEDDTICNMLWPPAMICDQVPVELFYVRQRFVRQLQRQMSWLASNPPPHCLTHTYVPILYPCCDLVQVRHSQIANFSRSRVNLTRYPVVCACTSLKRQAASSSHLYSIALALGRPSTVN